VLKKAGIVLAAATAGLLAVSPLAFAGDYDGDHDPHHHGHHGHHGHPRGHEEEHHGHAHGAACKQDNGAKDAAKGPHKQLGLVNLQDNTVQVPIQACNNSVIEGVLGILASHQENSDDHG
jgi:hypothetical protein